MAIERHDRLPRTDLPRRLYGDGRRYPPLPDRHAIQPLHSALESLRDLLPPFGDDAYRWSAADVYYERARLAALDPEGEAEAGHPMTEARARSIMLWYHEPPRRPKNSVTWAPRAPDRSLLDRLGADPSRDHGMVRCPAHDDRTKSLSWRWTGEKPLLKCFAGCSFDEIRMAVS